MFWSSKSIQEEAKRRGKAESSLCTKELSRDKTFTDQIRSRTKFTPAYLQKNKLNPEKFFHFCEIIFMENAPKMTLCNGRHGNRIERNFLEVFSEFIFDTFNDYHKCLDESEVAGFIRYVESMHEKNDCVLGAAFVVR